MKKTILLSVSFLMAVSAVGIIAFYVGTQAASGYWLRQYLRQVARDEWVLEKVRCSVEEHASPDEIEWFERELRDAERVLAHEEYAEIVGHDQEIQRLRERISILRGDGTATDESVPGFGKLGS